jgi:hypothetical protein
VAKGFELKVADVSGLTDADWTAINKVISACEAGGFEVFWDEIDKLGRSGPTDQSGGGVFP